MADRAPASSLSNPRTVRLTTFCLCVVLAFVAGILTGTMFTGYQLDAERQSANMREQPADAEQHIRQIEQLVQKNPGDSDLWFHLGNACYDARQPDKAITAYRRGLELDADNVNARTDLGTMYRLTGQFEQALHEYDLVIARDPRHKNARFNKGIVLYYDLGRKEEALTVWKALVGVLPDAKAPDGSPMSEFIAKHAPQ